MRPSPRLGGFKILNEVVWISLTQPEKGKKFPTEFFHILAKEKINISFLTCGNQNQAWGLNIVVDTSYASNSSNLIEKNFDEINPISAKAAILSIFPHKSNPEIIGALLEVFVKVGVQPVALANSHSAISVVLREDTVSKATAALFDPFRFGAYRTPADWKLAQKGKEKLYKEVVASYQEKKPKIYGLEWQEEQELLHVKLDTRDMSLMGTVFKDFARLGIFLTFLISSPSHNKRETNLLFCLPESDKRNYSHMIRELLPEAVTARFYPVAFFSMNGPHFGDRYGIASELLMALDSVQVEIIGLSCSIHSITGVLPADQIHDAIRAIQTCFDVPSVIKKN